MRHRIKQKLNQLHCNDVLKRPTHSNLANSKPHHCSNGYTTNSKHYNHLLHSDKGTYFYKSQLVKLNKTLYSSAIPLAVCASVFLLVLGLMIYPIQTSSISSSVYALDGNDDAYAISTTSITPPTKGVALGIDTTLPDDDTLVNQVTGSGVHYISVNFSVGANDVDDYKVYVQADSTSLTGSTYNDMISSINTNTPASSIGKKEWGYAVVENADVKPDTLTYQSIQTGTAKPAVTKTATSGSKLTNISQPYTLAFAANLEGAKADHYRSNIVLSVAASATDVALGFSDLKYMQDMTSPVCYHANVGDSARLTDIRDGKQYWVSKLADGNCWMVQNLDLDLKAGTILEPGTSDVPTSWNPDNDTIKATAIAGAWNNTEATTKAYSYDPGMWVYSTPDKVSNCNQATDSTGKIVGTSDAGASDYSTGVPGLTSDTCTKYGWEDVTNKTPSPDPNFYIYGYTADGKVVNGDTYDAHYLVGNYYSWPAATAGQAKDVTANNDNTTQSICPKGWTLPKAGKGDGSNPSIKANEPFAEDKTFYKLLKEYGYYGYIWEKGQNLTDDDNLQPIFPISSSKTGYNLLKAPLYLLRGGDVHSSLLDYAGNLGGYWSSTAGVSSAGTQYTFYLRFDGANVSPSSYRSGYLGFSIRCVAR